MAPKPKKTKEEKAAEKARKEEEARLAEEERLRQDEEARKVAEQHEQTRQRLLEEFKAAEAARLHQERQELVPFLQLLLHDRAVAGQEQSAQSDWQRYLSSNPLPDPRNQPDMNDYFNSLHENRDNRLEHVLDECEGCVNLAKDCLTLAAQETMSAAAVAAVASLAAGSAGSNPESMDADISMMATNAEEVTVAADARAAQYRADAEQLYQHVGQRMDAATARVLQNSDQHADDKGDVLLAAQQGPLQWGLWVNTYKNPRFKLIDFSGLGMTVEIPKQIALASVALRVQRRPHSGLQQHPGNSTTSNSDTAGAAADPQQANSSSCLAPLGGILQVDLLTLPPAAKQSKDWTIRQVSLQLESSQSQPPASAAGGSRCSGCDTQQQQDSPQIVFCRTKRTPTTTIPQLGAVQQQPKLYTSYHNAAA
eukprot:GHUV01028341.1.p1 GENE.GHUV01028341.1~~GHUV01028341.1.p1  ORF type:complete len:424 (+),score=159.44 GHUV01028341.1:283-1554(+)